MTSPTEPFGDLDQCEDEGMLQNAVVRPGQRFEKCRRRRFVADPSERLGSAANNVGIRILQQMLRELLATLRDTQQDHTLLKTDIKRQRTSPISMMPEGLLEGLSTADARDLIGYLASPAQGPLK